MRSTSKKGKGRTVKTEKNFLSGEDSLIDTLSQRFSSPHPKLIKGIGDDTSVTLNTPSTVLLATTDTLVDSTHFTLKNSTPEQIGAKALNVSISDIAAMGGRPTFFLVSLILPAYINTAFVTALYRGISSAARKSGATLAGGNITAGKGLAITVTLFGEAAEGRVVYRSGARPGDGLYVTGTLGDAALGLKILGSRGSKGAAREAKIKEYAGAVKRQLAPVPRLKAGIMLAKDKVATSMIDLSDGLALDAARLAGESGVGLTVQSAALPLSSCMKRFMAAGKKRAEAGLAMALSGGEEYELLFTAAEKSRRKIENIASDLGLKISLIGTVNACAKGVTLLNGEGRRIELKQAGYTHL